MSLIVLFQQRICIMYLSTSFFPFSYPLLIFTLFLFPTAIEGSLYTTEINVNLFESSDILDAVARQVPHRPHHPRRSREYKQAHVNDSRQELRHVARLRLARILLYQDKAQEVVDLLAAQDVDAFAAAYGEVLGDAYTALGQIAEAQDAYQKILLDPLSQGTVDQQLVQWKALDLPQIEAQPESAEGMTAEPELSPAVELIDAADEESAVEDVE